MHEALHFIFVARIRRGIKPSLAGGPDGGTGDSVRSLIFGITGVVIWLMGVTCILTQCPDPPSREVDPGLGMRVQGCRCGPRV